MDPNAAWSTIFDTASSYGDVVDATHNLMSWIRSGGFMPDAASGMTRDQVLARLRSNLEAERLDEACAKRTV